MKGCTAQEDGLRARKKRETRRALERAALELVVDNGFEKTTVDDICERAGVSRMTFFNYFPSKAGAIFGHVSKPPTSAELTQRLEEHEEGHYLDALLDILDVLFDTRSDPEIEHLRRQAISQDSSLLFKEQQGTMRLEHDLAEALFNHLTAHPERRMIDDVSVKEEAFMGTSFALYLLRCATFRRVVSQTAKTRPDDIRRYVAAYTQVGGEAGADEAGM